MAKKRAVERPPVEPRTFRSTEEIDRGIKKLERRIRELEALDVRSAALEDTGAKGVVQSNIRETIREVFGPASPEFHEHQYLEIWNGPIWPAMTVADEVKGTERGRNQVRSVLEGLIARLQEKKE